MFKKTISMLLLTATISMTVAVPGYAAMKITDANSFKWSQTGSEWKVVDGSGKVYNLRSAKSASGARYTSKGGDIEFFTSGNDALFTGPSGIETSCVKK